MEKIKELQDILNELIGKKFSENFTMTSKEISDLIGVEHKEILERIYEIEGYDPIGCKELFSKIGKYEYLVTRQGFIPIIGVFDTNKSIRITMAYWNLFYGMIDEIKNFSIS